MIDFPDFLYHIEVGPPIRSGLPVERRIPTFSCAGARYASIFIHPITDDRGSLLVRLDLVFLTVHGVADVSLSPPFPFRARQPLALLVLLCRDSAIGPDRVFPSPSRLSSCPTTVSPSFRVPLFSPFLCLHCVPTLLSIVSGFRRWFLQILLPFFLSPTCASCLYAPNKANSAFNFDLPLSAT